MATDAARDLDGSAADDDDDDFAIVSNWFVNLQRGDTYYIHWLPPGRPSYGTRNLVSVMMMMMVMASKDDDAEDDKDDDDPKMMLGAVTEVILV